MEYFKEQDFLDAKKQKTKDLIIFFVVFAIYLGVSVFMLVYYLNLPYKSPKIATVKYVEYPLSAVFVIFAFIYLGIVYKKVKRFYNLTYNLKTGIREQSIASFFEYDENIHDKDGVDCKALIFLEWNKYKKDFFERKVLVFYEREFPKIPEKANVKFITQGNFLISYEILEENKEITE